MTPPTQSQFREAERCLDEILRRDTGTLTANDVSATDRSERQYHYKNEYLSWRYRFETRRSIGSEIAAVVVQLTLYEFDATVVRVWSRAEIFQIGQRSRWQKTDETTLPLKQLVSEGIGRFVLKAVARGKAAVESAAKQPLWSIEQS